MTTLLPSIFEVFWTQAFVALPSMRMVQVPHAPSEQPFFTEVSSSSSRKKVMSFSSLSVDTDLPFTVKVNMSGPPFVRTYASVASSLTPKIHKGKERTSVKIAKNLKNFLV